MDRLVLEQVLEEQRETIQRPRRGVVPRREAGQIRLDSELAQVVIGVRRCGKSTLCQSVLLGSGRPFGYVNFDDERLATLQGEDLNAVLGALYKLNGPIDTLFLDEIQNIPEWNLFVNRLLRQGMHVVVTGSNAKLLSGELATHMTGRYHEIALFPFSFAECCAFRGVDMASGTTQAVALRQRALDAYLTQGGFPELVREPQEAATYLRTLVPNVLERDIRQRFHLRTGTLLRGLADYLLGVAPTILNYKALGERLETGLSLHTLKRYVDYLKQAYLLIGVPRWSNKLCLRLRNEKVYPVDVGLMGTQGGNWGWRLETVVLLELLRRHRPFGRDVLYFRENRSEADFVVCQGRDAVEIVQVAYALGEPRLRARELNGAVAAAKALRRAEATLVTYADSGEACIDGVTVRIRPAHEWLCAP